MIYDDVAYLKSMVDADEMLSPLRDWFWRRICVKDPVPFCEDGIVSN